jgi:glutathione S-transferase
VLRLITIPISHYCEKARWALERAGIEYHEERHVQGIHQLVARRAGGGTTVPVLVTPKLVLGESEQILMWADPQTSAPRRLFPDQPNDRAEVERLCRRFDAGLGPHGRRLIYVHMLAEPKLMLHYNNQGVPRWEDRALRHGWPMLTGVIRRALDIRPGVEVEDEAVVWRELEFVAELLSDGRRYLCGERFSAADLTFAALSAPIVVPSGYGVRLPEMDELPARTSTLVQRVREHPGGRHALAMFAAHRRERDVGAPVDGGPSQAARVS